MLDIQDIMQDMATLMQGQGELVDIIGMYNTHYLATYNFEKSLHLYVLKSATHTVA